MEHKHHKSITQAGAPQWRRRRLLSSTLGFAAAVGNQISRRRMAVIATPLAAALVSALALPAVAAGPVMAATPAASQIVIGPIQIGIGLPLLSPPASPSPVPTVSPQPSSTPTPSSSPSPSATPGTSSGLVAAASVSARVQLTESVVDNTTGQVVNGGGTLLAKAGDQVTVTINYNNISSSLLAQVTGSDVLGSLPLTNINVLGGHDSNGVLQWLIGDLSPGVSGSLRFTGVVSVSATKGISICAHAAALLSAGHVLDANALLDLCIKIELTNTTVTTPSTTPAATPSPSPTSTPGSSSSPTPSSAVQALTSTNNTGSGASTPFTGAAALLRDFVAGLVILGFGIVMMRKVRRTRLRRSLRQFI